MPFTVDTGNGATLTLGTTAFVGQYEEIDAGDDKLGKIEDSYLGTTIRKTFIPEDLVDSGELKGTTQFNNAVAIPSLGTIETATLTWPLKAGQSTPATLVGTGFLTKFSRPRFVNNQKQMAEIEFSYNGKTGPVFTPAS